MHKNDNKDNELLKNGQNISNENYRGNIYDIEAFSLLSEFNIILLNEDYTINKNINIFKNDNSVIVYLIQNYNKDHFEAIIPKKIQFIIFKLIFIKI